jgi:hypothetical protein
MLPEIEVEFCITGSDLLPQQITAFLDLTPTRAWLKGDSIQGTKLRRKHHGWSLSLGEKAPSLDLGKQIDNLIAILLPKNECINWICNEFHMECEVACAVWIKDETPSVNLGPQTLLALSRLNSTLDIDVILTR